MSKFETHSIRKTNELFYAGAVVVTNRLREKIDKVSGREEPMWKRRLQNKIKELRKDLSQLEASKDKDISSFRHWERLEKKYSIRVKSRKYILTDVLTGVYSQITYRWRRYRLFFTRPRNIFFEIYEDSDLKMNNNKETNAILDSESDDRNKINEDVKRTQHDSNRKTNMNTSFKLPKKKNDNIVCHNPDSNLWDKVLVIKSIGSILKICNLLR